MSGQIFCYIPILFAAIVFFGAHRLAVLFEHRYLASLPYKNGYRAGYSAARREILELIRSSIETKLDNVVSEMKEKLLLSRRVVEEKSIAWDYETGKESMCGTFVEYQPVTARLELVPKQRVQCELQICVDKEQEREKGGKSE